MRLFKDKYRIESNRRPGRDYAAPGRYFVTICTKNRQPWFGDVCDGTVKWNEIGCIVADEIRRSPQVRSNVAINDWIVMPDHVHMIITMEPNDCSSTVETHRRCVSTWVDECIPLCRRRPGTLGSIVAQFKSLCTKRIRAMGCTNFTWQSNYHERMIRSDAMEHRIRQYITENPLKWEP